MDGHSPCARLKPGVVWYVPQVVSHPKKTLAQLGVAGHSSILRLVVSGIRVIFVGHVSLARTCTRVCGEGHGSSELGDFVG